MYNTLDMVILKDIVYFAGSSLSFVIIFLRIACFLPMGCILIKEEIEGENFTDDTSKVTVKSSKFMTLTSCHMTTQYVVDIKLYSNFELQ